MSDTSTTINHKRGRFNDQLINKLKDGQVFYDVSNPSKGIYIGQKNGEGNIDIVRLSNPAGGNAFVILEEGQYDPETKVPTIENPKLNNIYLVPKDSGHEVNTYIEWIYASSKWEKIGDTEIDLSGYVKSVNGVAASAENVGAIDVPETRNLPDEAPTTGTTDEFCTYLQANDKAGCVYRGTVNFEDLPSGLSTSQAIINIIESSVSDEPSIIHIYLYNTNTDTYSWEYTYNSESLKSGWLYSYTSSKIDELLNTKQNTSNRVSAWSTILSDDNYPSEKLVKDSLDAKENVSNKVSSFSGVPSDNFYPTEKLVKDSIDTINTNIQGLAAIVDTKADKVASATYGHFAGLNEFGNLIDSGKKADDFAVADHTHTFDSITSKPTTLTGYGITDAIKTVNSIVPDTAGNVNVKAFTGINDWFSTSDYQYVSTQHFCDLLKGELDTRYGTEQVQQCGLAFMLKGAQFNDYPESFITRNSAGVIADIATGELFIYVQASGLFTIEMSTTNNFERKGDDTGGVAHDDMFDSGKFMTIYDWGFGQGRGQGNPFKMLWSGYLMCPQSRTVYTTDTQGNKCWKYVPEKDYHAVSKYYLDQQLSTKANIIKEETLTYTTGETYTLSPNTYNVLDCESAAASDTITLKLGDKISDIYNEFTIELKTGANVPTISIFPDQNVTWFGESAPNISANKKYQISVVNGLAVAAEFNIAA